MTTPPVLIITGASSGIGAATARLAVSRGWRLVLAARTRHAIDELAAELGGPAAARAACCDVSDWDQVSALPAAALDAFGRLDAVFANAGAFTPTSFLHGTGTPQQWREMVLTNVYGTALTARRPARADPRARAPDPDRLGRRTGHRPRTAIFRHQMGGHRHRPVHPRRGHRNRHPGHLDPARAYRRRAARSRPRRRTQARSR